MDNFTHYGDRYENTFNIRQIYTYNTALSSLDNMEILIKFVSVQLKVKYLVLEPLNYRK